MAHFDEQFSTETHCGLWYAYYTYAPLRASELSAETLSQAIEEGASGLGVELSDVRLVEIVAFKQSTVVRFSTTPRFAEDPNSYEVWLDGEQS